VPELSVRRESWPLRGEFRISRDAKHSAEVVVAELQDDGVSGRGECVPYARYGESVAAVMALLEELREEIRAGLDRHALQARLPAGAARNALDCAFWDLEAKRAGTRVWTLAGLAPPQPVVTAYTLSLDEPAAMRAAATANAHRPVLKLKLGGAGDIERVERCTNRVSRRSSRRATRLLTSEREMPSCFAAAEKLRVLATKQKTMTSLE